MGPRSSPVLVRIEIAPLAISLSPIIPIKGATLLGVKHLEIVAGNLVVVVHQHGTVLGQIEMILVESLDVHPDVCGARNAGSRRWTGGDGRSTRAAAVHRLFLEPGLLLPGHPAELAALCADRDQRSRRAGVRGACA